MEGGYGYSSGMYISDWHLGTLPCPHWHTSVPLPMLVPLCLLFHADLPGLPCSPLGLKSSPKEAVAAVAAHGWGVGKAKQGGKSGWLFFPRTRQREPDAPGNGHPWRAGTCPGSFSSQRYRPSHPPTLWRGRRTRTTTTESLPSMIACQGIDPRNTLTRG